MLRSQRVADRPRALDDALDLVSPDRLTALLSTMVRIPSVTGTAAESEAQHVLEGVMRAAGLTTDLWRIDLEEVLADPGFPGLEAPRTEAWGLVGSTDGSDGPVLVLNGHIDVVPTGDLSAWTVDPFAAVVRDGRLLGRGACDMKAGLACQLMAATVLAEAGVRLRGRLVVHSVVGEEDGGLGTFATLRRGHAGDLAVIAEPTSSAVVAACAGALTFRLVLRGRAAHASVRDDGVDVMDAYVLVHRALRDLETARNRDPHPLLRHRPIPYAVSVGTVRAGDWPSSVPDLLVAEGRLGVALGEDPAEARAALEEALSSLPVEVQWFGGQFAPGAVEVDSPLVQQVSAAHAAVHGRAPDVIGAPYGSDLRLLTAAGIPTVLYGPGDVRDAHAPDESVAISELVDVTRALVLLSAEVCGLR